MIRPVTELMAAPHHRACRAREGRVYELAYPGDTKVLLALVTKLRVGWLTGSFVVRASVSAGHETTLSPLAWHPERSTPWCVCFGGSLRALASGGYLREVGTCAVVEPRYIWSAWEGEPDRDIEGEPMSEVPLIRVAPGARTYDVVDMTVSLLINVRPDHFLLTSTNGTVSDLAGVFSPMRGVPTELLRRLRVARQEAAQDGLFLEDGAFYQATALGRELLAAVVK